MRYLSLIAVIAALALSAAGGHLVWGDYVSGADQIVWGD